MLSRIRRRRFSQNSGSGYNSEIDAYLATIADQSGTISEPHIVAVDTFVSSAKANGYWSQLELFAPMAGENLAAALVPVKGPLQTHNNLVEGDYAPNEGISAVGAGKRIHTNFNLSTDLSDSRDAHLGIYVVRPPAAGGDRGYMGVASGTSKASLLWVNSSGILAGQLGVSSENYMPWTTAPPVGHLIVTNRASNNGKLFADGAQVAAETSFATNARANIDIPVFAINTDGTPGQHAQATAGCYHIGRGLTDQQVTDLTADVAVLMAALGRTVPPEVDEAFVINGTGTVGQTLTKTAGSWSGADSVVQNWQRDGTDIPGATADTFQTDPMDAFASIRLRSTATNAGGSSTTYSNGIFVEP